MTEVVRSTIATSALARGDMRPRWTAAGMLVAEQQFRRIIGYRDLAALVVVIGTEVHARRPPSPLQGGGCPPQ
jgi:hypothetical protein